MISFDDIEYASTTDVGVKRSHNQDAHVLMPASDDEQWQHRGHVFIVADGMGGHAVGELASKMAVDNIPHIYSKYVGDGTPAALRKAFVETNAAIHNRGQQVADFHRMGTTGTAFVLRPEGAWVGHVGDSRAYRIRQGMIEQLSFDHSMVWELARRHHKRPEQMTGIPSNVIVRSLGPEPLVEVDVEGPHPMQPGDIYLLCSDGLSGQVSDREIGAVASALTPPEATRFLMHLANLQGGPDNSTVVIVRVHGVPEAQMSESQASILFPPEHSTLSERLLRRLAVWLATLPWAMIVLVSGILLGIGAMVLLFNQFQVAALLAFILAGLSLIGGLLALMLQSFREDKSASPFTSNQLQVYRQTRCDIDAELVERLDQARLVLEGRIIEKNWTIDDSEYRTHVEKAAAHLQHRDLTAGFGEQCRAILVLMETIHQQRGKEEAFKPLWDRPAPSP